VVEVVVDISLKLPQLIVEDFGDLFGFGLYLVDLEFGDLFGFGLSFFMPQDWILIGGL